MAYSYSSKHLGAGTIGGRGFWVCREASYAFSAAQGPFGNTNLNLERPLNEALVFNEKLPMILNQSVLEFMMGTSYWDAINIWQFWRGSLEHLWPSLVNVATFNSKNLYAYAGWFDDTFKPMQQRHADRVLFDNQQGDFLSSAVRIPIGESGYTDTLPGLFVIKPVAGTIVSGEYCYVTLTPYSNTRVWTNRDSARVHVDHEADFGTVDHPYIKKAANMIRVDLTAGNHNKHVIPGVDLQLNSPLEGDHAVVSIGYEYINAFGETGVQGNVVWMKDYFMPLSARAIMPYGLGYEEYPIRPVYLTGGSNYLPSRWHIYNVTGAEQSGCKFIIRPLVRLDQGNRLTPFDQWFMGYDYETTLTKGTSPYQITFVNYVAGSPATVKMVFSDTGTDMTIREIDPDTYEPTGTVHTDGEGLKCDGLTLYRWDDLGIYFVLSEDLNPSQGANVCVRNGCSGEQIISHINENTTAYTLIQPPTSLVIGGWDSYYNSSSGLYYPASFSVDPADRTGVMQTQGYDFAFSNSSVSAVWQHWYNHSWAVPTWFYYSDYLTDYANPNEYAVMVVCDDPRYFHVVPCMWSLSGKYSGWSSTLEALNGGQANPKMTMQVSVPDAESLVNCTGTIHERQGSLVLRVNQMSAEIVDLLANSGITLE